ncbi:MAG: hypothetical protein ACHQK9_01010 [Reyranellales bacterium]
MPLHWTISHPDRLVVATCKDRVSLKDIENYLDGVVVAEALPYAKIFDLSQGVLDLGDNDMMLLGARIRAYSTTMSVIGPLAIVATSPKGQEQARLFTALADAKRQVRIFRDLQGARQWLAGLTAS